MSGFFSWSIYIFRAFGINVRMHVLFIVFAAMQIGNAGSGKGEESAVYLAVAACVFIGLFICILLHEFGHALASRWCDGDADEILIWPLGGLALCRPPFHPTAHLITAAAGPLVTLAIWGIFCGIVPLTEIWKDAAVKTAVINAFESGNPVSKPLAWHVHSIAVSLRAMNLWLLLFNLIPAFPMDGGRILRDTLWHFMSCEKATRIAVWVGRVAAVAMIVYGLTHGMTMLVIIAAWVLMTGEQEIMAIVGHAASGHYGWSLKDRLKRGPRRKRFREQMAERMEDALHTCRTCGRTDVSNPDLDFRVTADGEEYCRDHLPRQA